MFAPVLTVSLHEILYKMDADVWKMFIELVQSNYQQQQLFIIFLLREAPPTVIFVN